MIENKRDTHNTTLIGHLLDQLLTKKIDAKRCREGKSFPQLSWGPWLSLKIKLTEQINARKAYKFV